MSPNFGHCMYLIFEPILLRRKFWGIPLRRNASHSPPTFHKIAFSWHCRISPVRNEGLNLYYMLRLDFSVQFADLTSTTCFQIDLHAHSLGSSPVTSTESFPACTYPPKPTKTNEGNPNKRQFKLHLGSLVITPTFHCLYNYTRT